MNLTTPNKTMNSLEIAELVGKRHDNVMADIRSMFQELGLNAPEFSGTQTYGNNNTREIFKLNKELTITLISGYDTNARYKIVNRWLELEAKHTQLLPQSHIAAVEAYLVTLKQVEAQQLELGMQAEQIAEDAILTEKSPEYYTVKQLRSLVPKPSGVVLSRVSAAMSYEVKSVYSQYDKMASNQYHKDVVNAIYGSNL